MKDEKMLGLLTKVVASISDEAKRTELEEAIQAIHNEEDDYPNPEYKAPASAMNKVGTAMELLKGVGKDTSADDIKKIVTQAIAALKTIAEGYEKPPVNIEYPEGKSSPPKDPTALEQELTALKESGKVKKASSIE